MKMAWICPQWARPECLRSIVRQFLAQDYPAEDLQLIILDDSGQFDTQAGDRWRIINVRESMEQMRMNPLVDSRIASFRRNRPFDSLPEKYNALLDLVPPDVDGVAVIETDDLYGPLHTAACAAALRRGHWCKPSRVLSDFAPLEGEPADGRFHASLAFRRQWLLDQGGWPETPRADFDQQLIAKLTRIEPPVDPLTLPLPGLEGVLMRRKFPMTYHFTWGSSGHTHAQAVTHGPDDVDWLQRARAAAGPISYIGKLFPDVDRPPVVLHEVRQPRDLREFATCGSFDGES